MNHNVRVGAAIAVGAVLGALGREALNVMMMSLALPGIDGVIVANIAGAGALGFATATLGPTTPEWFRQGLTTGFLGTFTTLSALSGFIAFTPSDFASELWVYVAGSIAGGVVAAWAGARAGEAVRDSRRAS